MKKIISLLFSLLLILSPAFTVYAEGGKVTYSKNASNFVFEPGSDHSLTDLFLDFKDVMPGDTITQKINVKNEASNKVKVKIYLRSLGAHEDSAKFLSQLGLTVQKSEENDMAYMFDATADKTAQLTDCVCLGTLYSGGEVNLDVTLNVPVELPDEFQNQVGFLDWEFKVEEFPVESDDPKPPPTGNNFPAKIWFAVMGCVLAVMILLLFNRKKDKENNVNPVER